MSAVATVQESPSVDHIERECRRCSEVKPLSRFVVARNCRHGRAWTCLACDKAMRRAKEGRASGWSVAVNRRVEAAENDPGVSEIVRRVLEVHRANDLPFDRAWRSAFRVALRNQNGQQRVNWRVALEWSKPCWRASYEGEKWPEPFVEGNLAALTVFGEAA